jgi:WD40 repeat protein
VEWGGKPTEIGASSPATKFATPTGHGWRFSDVAAAILFVLAGLVLAGLQVMSAISRSRRWVAAAVLFALAGLCVWAAPSAGLLESSRVETVERDDADGPVALAMAPFDRFATEPFQSGDQGVEGVKALGWGARKAPAVVAISPDGEWLAAAIDKSVYVYRAGETEAVATLEKYLPDNWKAFLMQMGDTRTKEKLEKNPGPVTALCFAPDSKSLIVGGSYPPETGVGGWVQIWRWAEGSIWSGEAEEMTTGVRALACVPGTDLLAVGGVAIEIAYGQSKETYPTLDLRQLDNGLTQYSVLEKVGEPVVGLTVSADGRRLAAVDRKGEVHLWALAHDPAPTGLAWVAAGLLGVSGVGALIRPRLSRKASCRVPLRLAGGLVGIALVACLGLAIAPYLGSSIQELEGVRLGAAEARPIALSPDGRTLAVGDDTSLRLYTLDRSAPRERRRLKEYKAKVSAVAFTRAGQWLVSLDAGGELRVTHLPTGQGTRSVKSEAGGPLAVSPDGRHTFAALREKPTVYRWWGYDGLDEVLHECDETLARRPDDLVTRERRARAYLKRGRLDRAVADLDFVLSHKEGPSREAFWLRALANARRDDRAAALADLDALIKLDPKDALAHYQRGLLLMRDKRYREARRSFDKAFELKPQLAAAHEKENQP